MNIFDFPGAEDKDKSVFYDKTYNLIPVTIDFLKDYTPPPRQIIEDFINKKDTLK
jgi:hypothetical protein